MTMGQVGAGARGKGVEDPRTQQMLTRFLVGRGQANQKGRKDIVEGQQSSDRKGSGSSQKGWPNTRVTRIMTGSWSSGRDRRLEVVDALGLVPRVTPLPRADQRATGPSEGGGGRSPQLSGQETRVHCPGAGTAWPKGEGSLVCLVTGAAWPLHPMACYPSFRLTFLPASLVSSPWFPSLCPVVWGRRGCPCCQD